MLVFSSRAVERLERVVAGTWAHGKQSFEVERRRRPARRRWGFVGAAPAPWRQTRLRCAAHTKARTCQGKETGGFRSTKPSYPFRESEGGTGGEPVSPNCAAQALRMEASGDTELKDKLSIQTPRTARREGARTLTRGQQQHHEQTHPPCHHLPHPPQTKRKASPRKPRQTTAAGGAEQKGNTRKNSGGDTHSGTTSSPDRWPQKQGPRAEMKSSSGVAAGEMLAKFTRWQHTTARKRQSGTPTAFERGEEGSTATKTKRRANKTPMHNAKEKGKTEEGSKNKDRSNAKYFTPKMPQNPK